MYFDPGTGSMLIQILLAAIPVAAAFFIGLRKKIFKNKNVNDHADIPAPVNKTDDGFEDIDND